MKVMNPAKAAGLAVAIAAAAAAATLPAAPAAAQARAPTLSGKTKLGVLIDDPRALEILRRHAPTAMADKDIGKGRGYSLKFVAGFDKEMKAALPAIERELAALPPR